MVERENMSGEAKSPSEVQRPQNMRAFMDLVKGKGDEARFWVDYWESFTNDDDPKDIHERFNRHPVTEQVVMNVVVDLRSIMRERIATTGSEELVSSLTGECHLVLRQYHAAMRESGIDVDIDLIDQYLRPTEMVMGYRASEAIASGN